MSTKEEIRKLLESKDRKEPFSVPEGYFESFGERLNKRLGETGEKTSDRTTIMMRIRPHLALAAAIAGFALISVATLQFLTRNGQEATEAYDLAMLEVTGVTNNESIVMESINFDEVSQEEGDGSGLSEWDQDAIEYLASNASDLELLLTEN